MVDWWDSDLVKVIPLNPLNPLNPGCGAVGVGTRAVLSRIPEG